MKNSENLENRENDEKTSENEPVYGLRRILALIF